MTFTDTVEKPADARYSKMSAAAMDCNAYRSQALARGRGFVAGVDRILEGVRARRQDSERLGRVNDATIAAMIDAGFFRTFTPLQYGGLEMDPASFFEGLIKLAQSDSSAAWVAGQLNVHSMQIALMSKRMQDEFWSDDPSTRASSSFAPLGRVEKVEEGYVLNGTWTFSSGVDHAQWVILGAKDRALLVPRSDFEIDHESWDVQGLRGTGSKSVTLTDVFVPDYRCHKYIDTFNDQNPGWEVNNRPLYWMSFPGLFFSTATNTAIGTALDGIQTFIEQSKKRLTRQGTGEPISANPFMQLKLAQAITAVTGVRNRHLANWHEMFDKACKGEEVTSLERVRIRYESADANATSFDAFQQLWPMAGASACATGNHLQEVFRHLMAARNHGTAGIELAAGAYMQVLFGMPPPPVDTQMNLGTLSYYK